jgi:hypothetical protein
MLLCATTGLVTGTQTEDGNAGPQILSENTIQNRDMWDVQFQYDVGGMTGSLYLGPAGFDGTYFYCPEWNSANIYQFNKNGTFVQTFTIPGVTSVRDIDYDGTYFYGGNAAGLFLWQMDFTAHTLVSTITLPVAARSCAYDPTADGGNGGFWVNVWTSDLKLVSRSGVVLDTLAAPESLYGSAWDDVTQISGYDGPFLWVFTGTATGTDGIIKVYDLATKTLVSGVTHNVAQELGAGIAGGLFITPDYEPGLLTLGGIIQGTDPINDYLFGYEISASNSPPETPNAPAGPTSGSVGVSYSFAASTTDPDGDNISYMFDWGDGNNSGWLGPYASGATATGSYAWDAIGTYNITVKAKDANGAESGVSVAHTIVITPAAPVLEIQAITGGLLKVKTSIKNTGTVAATNVSWSIKLDGGLILLGKQTTGTIPTIAAGGEVGISSKLILGFGATVITVTAGTASKTQDAKVLLFFIKIV